MIQFRRRHKYGAKKTIRDGLKFDSKLEADLYGQLILEQHAGKISQLERQPKVYLTEARILYKPDFKFWDHEVGECVWAEAKGMPTTDWKLKLRLWAAGYGPGRLRIYKRVETRVVMVEEVRSEK